MIKKNPNIKEFDLSTFKGGRNTHGHQSELNPNAGKYGPENLRIRTLFTHGLYNLSSCF